MLLGLVAGGWLKGEMRSWSKVGLMFVVGLIGLGLGYAADRYGICPNVKRIWTSSWVLFSGGWCFVLMSVFYAVIDAIGLRAWSYPLRVIGRNSIAAYMMAHLIGDFTRSSFRTHLGPDVFQVFGETYEPLVTGITVLAVYWLILFWMDRQKIYLRV
jgi:predicted acyltransferase